MGADAYPFFPQNNSHVVPWLSICLPPVLGFAVFQIHSHCHLPSTTAVKLTGFSLVCCAGLLDGGYDLTCIIGALGPRGIKRWPGMQICGPVAYHWQCFFSTAAYLNLCQTMNLSMYWEVFYLAFFAVFFSLVDMAYAVNCPNSFEVSSFIHKLTQLFSPIFYNSFTVNNLNANVGELHCMYKTFLIRILTYSNYKIQKF